jgi:hypothetical protein
VHHRFSRTAGIAPDCKNSPEYCKYDWEQDGQNDPPSVPAQIISPIPEEKNGCQFQEESKDQVYGMIGHHSTATYLITTQLELGFKPFTDEKGQITELNWIPVYSRCSFGV